MSIFGFKKPKHQTQNSNQNQNKQSLISTIYNYAFGEQDNFDEDADDDEFLNQYETSQEYQSQEEQLTPIKTPQVKILKLNNTPVLVKSRQSPLINSSKILKPRVKSLKRESILKRHLNEINTSFKNDSDLDVSREISDNELDGNKSKLSSSKNEKVLNSPPEKSNLSKPTTKSTQSTKKPIALTQTSEESTASTPSKKSKVLTKNEKAESKATATPKQSVAESKSTPLKKNNVNKSKTTSLKKSNLPTTTISKVPSTQATSTPSETQPKVNPTIKKPSPQDIYNLMHKVGSIPPTRTNKLIDLAPKFSDNTNSNNVSGPAISSNKTSIESTSIEPIPYKSKPTSSTPKKSSSIKLKYGKSQTPVESSPQMSDHSPHSIIFDQLQNSSKIQTPKKLQQPRESQPQAKTQPPPKRSRREVPRISASPEDSSNDTSMKTAPNEVQTPQPKRAQPKRPIPSKTPQKLQAKITNSKPTTKSKKKKQESSPPYENDTTSTIFISSDSSTSSLDQTLKQSPTAQNIVTTPTEQSPENSPIEKDLENDILSLAGHNEDQDEQFFSTKESPEDEIDEDIEAAVENEVSNHFFLKTRDYEISQSPMPQTHVSSINPQLTDISQFNHDEDDDQPPVYTTSQENPFLETHDSISDEEEEVKGVALTSPFESNPKLKAKSIIELQEDSPKKSKGLSQLFQKTYKQTPLPAPKQSSKLDQEDESLSSYDHDTEQAPTAFIIIPADKVDDYKPIDHATNPFSPKQSILSPSNNTNKIITPTISTTANLVTSKSSSIEPKHVSIAEQIKKLNQLRQHSKKSQTPELNSLPLNFDGVVENSPKLGKSFSRLLNRSKIEKPNSKFSRTLPAGKSTTKPEDASSPKQTEVMHQPTEPNYTSSPRNLLEFGDASNLEKTSVDLPLYDTKESENEQATKTKEDNEGKEVEQEDSIICTPTTVIIEDGIKGITQSITQVPKPLNNTEILKNESKSFQKDGTKNDENQGDQLANDEDENIAEVTEAEFSHNVIVSAYEEDRQRALKLQQQQNQKENATTELSREKDRQNSLMLLQQIQNESETDDLLLEEDRRKALTLQKQVQKDRAKVRTSPRIENLTNPIDVPTHKLASEKNEQELVQDLEEDENSSEIINVLKNLQSAPKKRVSEVQTPNTNKRRKRVSIKRGKYISIINSSDDEDDADEIIEEDFTNVVEEENISDGSDDIYQAWNSDREIPDESEISISRNSSFASSMNEQKDNDMVTSTQENSTEKDSSGLNANETQINNSIERPLSQWELIYRSNSSIEKSSLSQNGILGSKQNSQEKQSSLNHGFTTHSQPELWHSRSSQPKPQPPHSQGFKIYSHQELLSLSPNQKNSVELSDLTNNFTPGTKGDVQIDKTNSQIESSKSSNTNKTQNEKINSSQSIHSPVNKITDKLENNEEQQKPTTTTEFMTNIPHIDGPNSDSPTKPQKENFVTSKNKRKQAQQRKKFRSLIRENVI
ncbi:hypothetical protein KGF54_001688 [Candida jiufengensis]|uniref:uncharacterized protein n=1 Tax=Candida jiufengensis TaxID=497108 RepID=UPI0022248B38|nr:uncharacterized protein KGF54_001688 [Candida jiufengensis]KAI5955127.1 hypothetical protein KGF54_001688 [Candida jiufengensis]